MIPIIPSYVDAFRTSYINYLQSLKNSYINISANARLLSANNISVFAYQADQFNAQAAFTLSAVTIEFINNIVSQAIVDATQTVGHPNNFQSIYDEFIYRDIAGQQSELEDDIQAQLVRNKNFYTRSMRQQNLEMQILLDNSNYTYKGAKLFMTARKLDQDPNYSDTLQRKSNSTDYMVKLTRSFAYGLYNEMLMTLLAANGINEVITYRNTQELEEKNIRLRIADKGDRDVPAYFDVKDRYFHPNAELLVRPIVTND